MREGDGKGGEGGEEERKKKRETSWLAVVSSLSSST